MSAAGPFGHEMSLRVRYSETDQMGTFYNSRALEWFECGRTELLRAAGIPYAWMESQGCLLPLVEAHLKFQGRARYDDVLQLIARAALVGRATLRFDVQIFQAQGSAPVTSGSTVHAVTNPQGKPMRAPPWLVDALGFWPEPSPISAASAQTDVEHEK